MTGMAALKASIIIVIGLVAVVYGLAGQTELRAGLAGESFCKATWPDGDTWIWTRVGRPQHGAALHGNCGRTFPVPTGRRFLYQWRPVLHRPPGRRHDRRHRAAGPRLRRGQCALRLHQSGGRRAYLNEKQGRKGHGNARVGGFVRYGCKSPLRPVGAALCDPGYAPGGVQLRGASVAGLGFLSR